MFKTNCCGRTNSSVLEMEKHDKEPQEKDLVVVIDPTPSKEVNYRLTYFDAKIGGEAIRFIFHKAGVPFEDNRVEGVDWASLKPGFKWGKLPVLEFDGNKIFSSTAIGRLLAKRFDLMGKDDVEAAKCDELVEVCQDIRIAWTDFFFESDPTKKDQLKTRLGTILSMNLVIFNSTVEQNGNPNSWLVGGGCTWADLFVVNFLQVCEDSVDSKILQEYPFLKKLKESVFSIPEIQMYIESRPVTSH